MSPSQRADRTQNALASPPMAELAKQDQPIQTSEHQYPTVWSLYGASKTDDVSNQLHNADSFQPSTPSNPPIPMNTSTSVSHTPSATASERLAKINDQVNRILAPVHALEALKFTEAGVDSYISNPSPVTSITPQAFSPQMPNTDPTPIRAGGRRGRGPRRRGSQLASGTITLASAATGTPVTPTSVRGRGQGRSRARASRGGRGKGSGRNGKRRRSDAEGGTSDSEASENFTPLEQSRSGRKIIHTAPLTPVIKIEDDETKGSPLSGKTSGSAGGRGSGKKRVASRKTPGGAGAVCKNCGRGHSPISNAIVFCDGCNTPWHQFCHTPPIGKDIVLIEEKAWYCSDCVVMKEERSRLQGKVAGQNLSMLEVGSLFSSFDKDYRAKRTNGI